MALVTSHSIEEYQSKMRLRLPEIMEAIRQDCRQQHANERSLLNRFACPIRNLTWFSPALGRVSSGRFGKLLEDQFYNPDAMRTALCMVDAILFLPSTSLEIYENIRYYLHGWSEMFKSDNGTVYENPSMILKSSGELSEARGGSEDLLHEGFVGLYGTNRLRNTIPNFAYVYAAFHTPLPVVEGDTYVLYEHIRPSVPLREYMDGCTAQEWLGIYMQILYSLRYAAQEVGFTHYDLHDRNVLIRKVGDSNPFSILYPTERGNEYLSTTHVATIIDYGLSHITYQGKHYGSYAALTYGVFPRRCFPLTDAYKLLMACAWSASGEVFAEMEKIFTFFTTESLGLAIMRQQKSLSFLPTFTDSTLDDLIRFIRHTCDCSFLTFAPKTPRILGCQGTDLCLSSAQILQQLPPDLLGLYDRIQDLLDDGAVPKVTALLSKFPYPSYSRRELKRLQNLDLELPEPIHILKVPVETIFTIDFIESYRESVYELARIKGDLGLYHRISHAVRYFANYYRDRETLRHLDVLEESVRPVREGVDAQCKELVQDVSFLNNPVLKEKYYKVASWYWVQLPEIVRVMECEA